MFFMAWFGACVGRSFSMGKSKKSSNKTEKKRQNKIIEDKTFGLKNKVRSASLLYAYLSIACVHAVYVLPTPLEQEQKGPEVHPEC